MRKLLFILAFLPFVSFAQYDSDIQPFPNLGMSKIQILDSVHFDFMVIDGVDSVCVKFVNGRMVAVECDTTGGGSVTPDDLITSASYDTLTDNLTLTRGDGSTIVAYIPQGSGGGGSISWGAIGGDINAQTDLITLLNAKLSESDTGAMLDPYLRKKVANDSFAAKLDTFTLKDSYSVEQHYHDSRRIRAIYDAQKIRDNAGVSPNVIIGNTGTVGLSDSSLLVAETTVVITSEAQAISESDSGDGSRANPYLIRNKLLNNSGATGASGGGLLWNDSDADYHIRMENCWISGYPTRNMFMNSPTTLTMVNCVIQGDDTYEAGGGTATGIDADLGTINISNTIFGGFGFDWINAASTVDSITLENCAFSNRFYNLKRNVILTGNVYWEIRSCETLDSLVCNNFFTTIDPEASAEIYASRNKLTVDANRYMFRISSGDAIATGAFWNNELRHKGERGIIYGKKVENFELTRNTFYGTGQLLNPLVFVDNGALNVRAFENKFTALGDALSEPIFFSRSINGLYENNWIVRSNADGYEFFNPFHSNRILNNVADSVGGQCVDWFTQQTDSANEQYGNTVENLYGDSYDVPVIITNTRGVTVKDIFAEAHNLLSSEGNYDTIPAVLLENRGWGLNHVPSDITILGLMPLPTSIQSGKILIVEDDAGTGNNAYYYDTSQRYFGLTADEIAKLTVK